MHLKNFKFFKYEILFQNSNLEVSVLLIKTELVDLVIHSRRRREKGNVDEAAVTRPDTCSITADYVSQLCVEQLTDPAGAMVL